MDKMSDLNELKELMDIAEAKARECENAWRKANDDFVEARNAYEEERDKDKSCDSCRYSIVLDFSPDGWHNLCGNDKAPCTCCHRKCEYYKPDNIVTKKIKDYYHRASKFDAPNFDNDTIEGLDLLGYDVYEESDNEERAQSEANEVIEILKICGKMK